MACGRTQPPDAAYALVLRVEAQPGRPVAGAAISLDGRVVGRTGDSGALALAVGGREGQHVSIAVACPDGFLSPAKPIDTVLHRLDDTRRKPEYEVSCRPLARRVVVVVRADRGPNLPVLHLGKEVARTDGSGAAHALLEVPVSDDVEITLGTTEPGGERLRPQNPSIKFVGAEPDEIRFFHVSFQLEPEPRRAVAPPVRMPIRIN
jgi:hypothetical protein